MKSLSAFMKKEWMEQIRSSRLMILGILFILFGIMNPAVAKLTPWLLETLADSLAETGLTVTGVTVTAMDSWVQFFKNIPMALIAFVLLESAIFTREYESGTLILALTKGLSRSKVVIAKSVVLLLLWTGLYWLCFGITYGYNAYFWDNSIAQNLGFSALCWWLFGLWITGQTVFFSTVFKSSAAVLVSTGGLVAAVYFLGLLPKLEKVLPTMLMDGNSLIYGAKDPKDYLWPVAIACIMCIVSIIASIPIINRKTV